MNTLYNRRLNLLLQIFALTTLFSIFLLIAFLLSGCQDNTIEGLKASSSVPFKVVSSKSSYLTVNGYYDQSTNLYYTEFDVEIDYTSSSSEKITGVSYTYKFSTGGTGGPYNISAYTSNNDYGFEVYDEGTSGGFRGTPVTATGELLIDNWHEVRFGSAASITYTYVISTNQNKTYTTSVTINKPAAAN